MKVKINLLIVGILFLLAFSVSSCNEQDAETEQKLEGTWTYSTTEVEDGVQMRVTAVETYTLEDHRFSTEITFFIGYPINARMCKVSYNGEWWASKDALINKIDKESVSFSFNKNLLDSSDRREFKEDMLKELKDCGYEEGVRIMSPVGDSFEAKDDEGERYTYQRIR